MKKKYVEPKTEQVHVESMSLMAVSGNGVSGDIGIGSGGIDDEGILTPESRIEW